MQAVILPHQSLDAVSRHRVADLAAGGYSHPRGGPIGKPDQYQEVGGAEFAALFGNPDVVRPLPKALFLGKTAQGPDPLLLGSYGYGQSLTPFGTPSLDDKPAILGGHTHQETMGPLPRRVARLKCSFHFPLTPEFTF